MSTVRIITVSVAAAALAVGLFLAPQKRFDERVRLADVAPGIDFGVKQNVPPHYASDAGVVVFNSHDLVPAIRGYAGPIRMLIALDRGGTISGIAILAHEETRNYVHYMESPEYIGRFVGKNVNDPFVVEQDVDGISRATVSVEALAKTVRESSRIIASDVLGLQVPAAPAAGRTGISWIAYVVLLLAGGAGYLLTRKSRRPQRLRDGILIAAIAIAGVLLASPFSVLHLYNLLLLRPSTAVLWYVVVISTLVSFVVAGRFYCGWICPFGALAEFIGRIPSRKWQVPADTDKAWRSVKYFLFIAVTALVFAAGRTELGNFETYVTLFARHGAVLAWLLVAASLMANIRVERFWCRFLCPVAALAGLLSRRAEGYPSRHDCPMGNSQHPAQSECIRCNRCFSMTEDRGSEA